MTKASDENEEHAAQSRFLSLVASCGVICEVEQDLAEYMGAFEDDAIPLEDALESIGAHSQGGA